MNKKEVCCWAMGESQDKREKGFVIFLVVPLFCFILFCFSKEKKDNICDSILLCNRVVIEFNRVITEFNTVVIK